MFDDDSLSGGEVFFYLKSNLRELVMTDTILVTLLWTMFETIFYSNIYIYDRNNRCFKLEKEYLLINNEK